MKPININLKSTANNINLSPGSYLMLEVSDMGTGINKEIISRIFEPYFTTKKQGEGTGMGLSIVHGIVNKHGGDIAVNSEPGIGTTFHVYLPLLEGTEPKEEEAPANLIPSGSERILLIDDEIKVAKMGKVILEDLGYNVTIYTCPSEALENFREQPESFDLVITDMTMPKITGIKLATETMSIQPDIPVILCTGFCELINEEIAFNIGIRRYLTKPYTITELAQSIREVIDEKSPAA